MLPAEGLLRFVVAADDSLAVDVAGRLPGRGIWLSPRRDVLDTAVAKRLFARSAGRSVRVPEDLARRVRDLLARRCLDILGLARRAGQAVAGFEKVREWLAEGRVAVRVEAVDGAPGGRAALARPGAEVPVVACLSSAELGRVMGHEHAVHVALAAGPLARRFAAEAARLAGFAELEDTGSGTGRPHES